MDSTLQPSCIYLYRIYQFNSIASSHNSTNGFFPPFSSHLSLFLFPCFCIPIPNPNRNHHFQAKKAPPARFTGAQRRHHSSPRGKHPQSQPSLAGTLRCGLKRAVLVGQLQATTLVINLPRTVLPLHSMLSSRYPLLP